MLPNDLEPMKEIVDVAKYLPWMKRVCSRRIVLDQLDLLLDGHSEDPNDKGSLFAKRIAQIKKDVVKIQS